MSNLLSAVFLIGLSTISAILVGKMASDDFLQSMIGCAAVLFGCYFQRYALVGIMFFVFLFGYYVILKKVFRYSH